MEGVYAGGGSMQIHVSESYIWHVDDDKEAGEVSLKAGDQLGVYCQIQQRMGGPNQGSSTGKRGGKDGRDG